MNTIKGTAYEIQIRDYIINTLNKQAFLWKHTPETVLIENGIIDSHNLNRLIRKDNVENPLNDTGVDIIQLEDNGKCSFVQCKNGYARGLVVKDLAGFVLWMCSHEDVNGYVYYTTKLSRALLEYKPCKRLQYIKQEYIDNSANLSKQFILDDDKLVYQQEASASVIKHLQSNNRGILSMPCGTGKTYISYVVSKKYEQVILISPLKEFARQNLERYIEYGYDEKKSLLIDSDGERNIDEIKKFMTSNASFLMSATYDSVDVIYKALKYMKKPLFVVDEFHNLSKTNMTDDKDDFNKLLKSDNKILFMSATPRVYEMEDDLEFDANDLLGDVIYHMSFKDAIQNKYITDYKIWLPSIHENNTKLLKELSVYKIDDVITAKCMFLFSCLLNNGSHKCIVYCTDTNELMAIESAIMELNDYYCMDIHVDHITCNDSAGNRKKRLKTFETSTKTEIMLSVRILDECIDIPSCDSIYITYPAKNKISTVQRLCRCIRIDKNNKYKMGHVFIWCNDYDKILNTLSSIKEYDEDFKCKIKIHETDWYEKSDKKLIEQDRQLIQSYIVHVKEYKREPWEKMWNATIDYITQYKKRPSSHDPDTKIRALGNWVTTQQHNYRLRVKSMKIKENVQLWTGLIEKYESLFASYSDEFQQTLDEVIAFIEENHKRPSSKAKTEPEKRLGNWVGHNMQNYRTKTRNMSSAETRKKWDEFIAEYKQYFQSDAEIKDSKLESCKQYIDKFKKLPSTHDKNEEIKTLGYWLSKLRNNPTLRELKIYKQFFLEYDEYFMTPEESWKKNFEKLEAYVAEKHKLPSGADKNEDIRYIGKWVGTQKRIFKLKSQIMKNDEIYELWKTFAEGNSDLL